MLIGRAGSDEPLLILEELAGQSLSIGAFVSSLLERLLHAWSDADARRLRVVLELEAARSPRFRARFNAGVERFFERLAIVLAAYQRSGAISPNHDPAALGWNLVAPVASLRSTLLAEGTKPSDRRLAAAIVARQRTLWLAAFAGPGTQGRP